MASAVTRSATGGAPAPPLVSPSGNALRWLLGLRLVVISALFLGVLIIQVNTHLILQLKHFYGLILARGDRPIRICCDPQR